MKLIEIENGDIFESKCHALVNPVNCVGVMGKGLALEFKKRFPEYFKIYQKKCICKIIKLGLVDIWTKDYNQFVFSFPTKQHWKDNSRLRDVKCGLFSLYHYVTLLEIKSIAIPALGCGLGGLRYDDVKELIEFVFRDTDLTIELYKPL